MSDNDLHKTGAELIAEGRAIGAPGFRRATVPVCYHCRHLETDLIFWTCGKHGLVFGGNGSRVKANTISWTAELVCGDFLDMDAEAGEDE